MANLAAGLRVNPLQLERVRELLAELDWVSRLGQGEAARQVLLRDPSSTLARPLVEQFLRAPGRATSVIGCATWLDSLLLAGLIEPA